ncbi:MAG: hypothetical protein PHF76_11520 [Bacteroidales bacterium]|nr:hypothetical protein [Bacteroidales bacterium]
MTQEEFQEVMDARAATSAPTTVSTPTSTPVPTPTSLAPDFKYSVGDVICDVDGENIYTGQIILDYRSTTDEYFIRIIGRDSVHGPWVEVYDYCPPEWKDRNGVNKQNEYLVGHVDVEPTWLTTPTPTATPVPTVTYQNGDLWIDVSTSRNRVGNLALALADDIDYMDFQSMKSNGEKLEQTAQRDYNTISKYRVSSDYQNLKTKYLSSLDKMKYAGKYCKMAADEFLKGNDDKGLEYLYMAQDYLDKANSDLNIVVKEMGW